jgi:hypothetical protein
MTIRYILDTDHLTLLQCNHASVITQFAALPPEDIAITVVSAMEQIRGRLAQVHRAKAAAEVVRASIRFQEALNFSGIKPDSSSEKQGGDDFTVIAQDSGFRSSEKIIFPPRSKIGQT